MFKLSVALLFVVLVSSCVVVPVTETRYVGRCGITHDKKTLKLIDVAKESQTYYDIGGLVLSPILIPVTAILSATYIATDEIYQYGKQMIVCRSNT